MIWGFRLLAHSILQIIALVFFYPQKLVVCVREGQFCYQIQLDMYESLCQNYLHDSLSVQSIS